MKFQWISVILTTGALLGCGTASDQAGTSQAPDEEAGAQTLSTNLGVSQQDQEEAGDDESIRIPPVVTTIVAARGDEEEQTPEEVSAADEGTCTVWWSAVQWDKERRQHFFHVRHDCNRLVYCYVKVIRSGKATIYGWNVPDSGKDIYVGILQRDDIVKRCPPECD